MADKSPSMKALKQDWIAKQKDNLIGELTDYMGESKLCDDEDHIDDCPACDAMRLAVDCRIGIIRSCMRE